ncbi:MAG: phenylalanine--tRNA ligase subunit beta, partial [Nitriliruptoraceae bacterium]
MKLPLSWLTAHVDLDLDVDELVHVMSMHGLEVEEVARPGASTAGVRVARVLEHRPHPDAERLRVVRVTGDGGDGEIELVCGADNFDVGDLVLHAPVGASIPGMTMEARALRGVVSNGMLCSPRELQLGDDHGGILVLAEDHPLGTELTDIVPIGEPVIEVAVQADRGDHLGIIGVARDLAAILDTTWRLPVVPQGPDDVLVPVTLDTDRCARFATWSLADVTVGPSPLWIRQRLAQCGIRSIDVVVDVTNLVMLETGQPLHAFDLETLRGRELQVREARAGESITTLDDVERSLDTGDVVIEDGERLASLAGVMGGRDTEVTAATREVLVEAAVWDPATIRATSRRLALVSEASVRYERRVDPAGAELAAARAAGLLMELAGARATGADVVALDPLPSWARRTTVDVDTDRVRALLGAEELDASTQQALLERSGCDVQAGDGPTALRVTAPTWRGDLRRPADLAEEIIRLHGYDRVPAQLPSVRQTGGLSPTQRLERSARDAALALGFSEAVIRPFVGDGALEGVQPSAGRVSLANPLAKDAAAMRPSLVEGLLGAVRRNVGQGRAGTALVELGRIFRPVDDPLASALDALGANWRWTGPAGEALPAQPRAMG